MKWYCTGKIENKTKWAPFGEKINQKYKLTNKERLFMSLLNLLFL